MAKLVEEARSGNTRARVELIVAHIPCAEVVSINRRFRDDAKSEALVQLVQEVDKYLASDKPAEGISAYLKGVAYNAAVSFDRNEERHVSRVQRIRGSSSGKRQGRDVECGGRVDENALEAVEEILAAAGPDYAVVVAKLQGLTNREGSLKLGMSESQFSKKLNAVRAAWRQRAEA